MPNHYAGDLLHTMAISGLSRVRTELFELTVIPALTPHPVQMHCQLCGPSLPSRSSVPAASPGERTYCATAAWLRTVTCAASTSKKRSSELPCLLMCPSRRRSPLDSSDGTSPT